jgi:hypothetical protein
VLCSQKSLSSDKAEETEHESYSSNCVTEYLSGMFCLDNFDFQHVD